MGLPVELVVNQLKAAGDETRIRLLALLQRGERTVKELTEILGQSQPRISRHLKVLAEAGLVSRSPGGSWVYYRLSDSEAAREVALGIVRGLDPRDARLRRDNERLAGLRPSSGRHAASETTIPPDQKVGAPSSQAVKVTRSWPSATEVCPCGSGP